MTVYEILHKKRYAKELNDEEIAFFIKGFTAGEIPDYQASALAMAICINGMNEREISTLTLEMMKSGDVVDLSAVGNRTVDKHSTGGVGDKTTLIVAPIVAALGGVVAKMSGRGLGHTGGTVDKLESIPGYKTTLSSEEFIKTVKENGICVVGQSGNLAPADKKLYALRDVTATVDSIPLIASSIMSKKLAAGAKSIVLDVKVGSGAFMKTTEQGRVLAEEMVKIGKNCGRNVKALISNMDIPLGDNIGNSLEVIEAIEVLKGKKGELRDLCICLSASMISAVKDINYKDAEKEVLECLDSGKALQKFKDWISSQGGKTEIIDDYCVLPTAKIKKEVYAEDSGYIYQMNAEEIGLSACALGAGRKSKDDKIDLSAGIILNKKTGDKIEKGDLLGTLYYSDEKLLENAEKLFYNAIIIKNEKPSVLPIVLDII